MLSQRLILKQQLSRISHVTTYIRYNSSNELDPLVESIPEIRLSAHKMKQPTRPPFAKNFFLAKYDVEFAPFPEPQTYERHGEFFEWLKPIEKYIETGVDAVEIDKTNTIPKEVIEQLQRLDIFRAAVPDAYRGLELNSSEYAKLVETVSDVPVLGALLSKHVTAVNLITKYASETQKAAYLPRIATGDCQPTVCISEDDQGSNGSVVLSKAKRSDCGKFWILNGKKTFIANAENSNLFIVFAECSDSEYSFNPEDTISAFLVDRDFGGITISPPIDSSGLRGLSLCDVTFKDTIIPKENMIGDIGMAAKLFPAIFGEGKQNIGSQAIGLTKKFLKLLVRDLKNDKDFNSMQFKNDAVQEVIGKICCSIYGMESVVYLTTGIIDNYAEQDCDIEKCIVESFCTDACIRSVLSGVQLLGSSAYIKGNEIEQIMRDAIHLTALDGSIMNTKTLIALLGVQYTGKIIAGNVKIRRNPHMFPGKILKRILMNSGFKNLGISYNLHPTLKITADLAESGINSLCKVVEEVITRNGQEIVNRHMELRRLSETVTALYVLTAVLSRASRSYCLGMRDSEKEIKIAQVFGYILWEKVEQLLQQLEAGDWVNGDTMIKDIADRAFEKDAYFPDHPLARNF